jgi:hypothetical protein
MVSIKWLKRAGYALAVAAVLSLPATANAQHWRGGGWQGGGWQGGGWHGGGWRGGGIGPGAAVALGLGSFALGTAVGSGAFAQPWGYYPWYYAPPPAYAYRTCWYPQFGGYYAC